MAVRPLSDESGSSAGLTPHFVTGPIWSLKAWPVEIDIAGFTVTIPAIQAVDWLTVLMEEDLWAEDILPGLLDEEDTQWVEDCLYEGTLALPDLHELALTALGVASGRPWWVALRLVQAVKQSWDIVGAELVLQGVDASRICLGAWLDVTTLIMLRSMKEDATTMWLLQLEMPPPEVEVAEPEVDADSFLSMG